MASKETIVRLHLDGMTEVQARIRALTSVLADRERELLVLKGPCSNKTCHLHYAHSGPCDIRERPVTTSYEVADGPKMLRETLCVAQTEIGASPWAELDLKQEHIARLQRLIDACDTHRPLGPDGKHGDRHTPTCGCEDA
jgi:hypothetical protein